MSQLARVNTAQEFYDYWHPRLSRTQAQSLENIKNACDVMESMAAQKPMNPSSVGGYCKEHLGVPPAAQTIRNMKRKDRDGRQIAVFLDYLRLRSGEVRRQGKKHRKINEKPKPPTYLELVETIADADTKIWVKDLVRQLSLAEGVCGYLEDQVREMSKEVGGLDMAGAITAGPTVENPMNLPVMSPSSSTIIESSPGLYDAIRKLLSIPENDELPYLQLNTKGALIFDDGVTGAVTILDQKQWQSLENAASGEG